MKMPGFTAEASLCKPRTSYRMMAGDTTSTLQVVPAAASCSSCYAYKTAPYVFRGNRYCCNRVCLPFLGCRNYCWVESCYPFSEGGVLV